MVIDLPIDNTIDVTDIQYYEHKFDTTGDPLYRCILQAAKQWHVHPDYIYVIARQENGTTGKYRKNESDGTHDVGRMQINYETWAVEFQRLGFHVDWRRVLFDLCDNVSVGTKIIQIRQGSADDALTAMANYHWFASANNNRPHFDYKAKITPIYEKLLTDKLDFLKKQDKN